MKLFLNIYLFAIIYFLSILSLRRSFKLQMPRGGKYSGVKGTAATFWKYVCKCSKVLMASNNKEWQVVIRLHCEVCKEAASVKEMLLAGTLTHVSRDVKKGTSNADGNIVAGW